MCHNPTIPAAGLSEPGGGNLQILTDKLTPISTGGGGANYAFHIQVLLAPPDFQTFLQFLPQITPSFHFLLEPFVLYIVPNKRHR